MNHKLKIPAYILLGALILMTDSFLNKFPIVYPDTSTYLASGMELETPFDRPITYGLFLRIFSLNGLSLWFVIFFQALILSYVIFLFCKLILEYKFTNNYFLVLILILSLFTGVSWSASQLMPDIFTSTGIISTSLILFGNLRGSRLASLYVIFFISVAMHMSHILLFTIILIVIFLFRKAIFQEDLLSKRTKQIGIMLLLTVASIVTMGSAMSKSKHVFFMGSMVEKGILKSYLDENCKYKKYNLCEYKDSLPTTFNDFVWKSDSPFQKVGGWKGTKKEFNEIIYATLTDPKYISMHIMESSKATVRQLVHFKIGDGNGSFLEGTQLYARVAKYFKRDLLLYTNSKQSQLNLSFIPVLNIIFTSLIVLSLVIIFLSFLSAKYFSKVNKQITFLLLFSILITAWDCGTFSMVADRFGCKVMWMIPFLSILFLLSKFSKSNTLPKGTE